MRNLYRSRRERGLLFCSIIFSCKIFFLCLIYIDIALDAGFDSEIDLWKVFNKYYLGHDKPEYQITLGWIEKRYNNLWIHCKNYEALESFSQNKIFNFFWHQEDKFTLTSLGFIWTYPNQKLGNNSVCVLPEIGFTGNIKGCYGICTDYAVDFLKKV